MCYGFSGSSSLKSKADVLKYAIEFTSTGEYPNRVPDMAKAKELFDFICENVQLPDVETDQLSNSLNGFTSMMERLSEKKKEAQDKVNEAVDTVEGIVEGEEPVKEEGPGLWELYRCIAAHAKAVGLKLHMGHGGNGEAEDVYCLDGHGEYLQVTLKYSIAPLPEKE
jgi:hypothetical protein